MKKTIFSVVFAILIFFICNGWVYLPDELLYKGARHDNPLTLVGSIWAHAGVIIIEVCCFGFLLEVGKNIFEYLKKD